MNVIGKEEEEETRSHSEEGAEYRLPDENLVEPVLSLFVHLIDNIEGV